MEDNRAEWVVRFFLWVFVTAVVVPALGGLRAASVEPFELPIRGEADARFRLAEHAGEIVVLDFFAYWCGPCLKASPVIEREIQQHYEHAGGNPAGIPVTVVAVNVEPAQGRRTDAFIRRTGISLVVDDSEGALLGQFSVEAIPLLVVVDGSDPQAGFRVAYQHAGFEGAAVLRGVIDSIVPKAEAEERPVVSEDLSHSMADPVEATAPEVAEAQPAWAFEQRMQASGEGLFTDDFQITRWTLQYGHDYGRTRWDLGVTYDTYDIDLRSPDPFFEPASADADRVTVQGNVGRELGAGVEWQGIAAYYDGFQSFRALWLHDYYQQIGELPFFGDYPDISPRGFQLGTQFRWEYLPATGFLEANFGFSKDWIAPSAEFEFETLFGLDVIDTFSYRLASENVLSPRLRSLVELQMADTKARERRYGIQGSLNAAVAESWVLRGQAGFVTENPEFEAYFVGVTVEHELSPSWLVSLFGRFYHDTGEIQNSLPASNAPPGLESLQLGLGLRWLGEQSSVRLSGGPYFTRYEDTEVEAPFFEDLYRSRDWGMFQVAYTLNF